MNIFALNDDPVLSAQDQCNKHVVKMIVESAQILCTVLHMRGVPRERLPYRPTHAHHPSTLWTNASDDNVDWLWRHAHALTAEYTNRYGKIHTTTLALRTISSMIPLGNWRLHTPFAQAMPNEWKDDDAVSAYRCYYIAEKSRFARWAPRSRAPSWWPFIDEPGQPLTMINPAATTTIPMTLRKVTGSPKSTAASRKVSTGYADVKPTTLFTGAL